MQFTAAGEQNRSAAGAQNCLDESLQFSLQIRQQQIGHSTLEDACHPCHRQFHTDAPGVQQQVFNLLIRQSHMGTDHHQSRQAVARTIPPAQSG